MAYTKINFKAGSNEKGETIIFPVSQLWQNVSVIGEDPAKVSCLLSR